MKRLKKTFEDKSVSELTLMFIGKSVKYGIAGLVGAFLMYSSIHDDFNLSTATAIKIVGDGVDLSFTRKDIEDYLNESDRQAIIDMTDLIVHEEFYKDIDISSKEDKMRIQEFYNKYIEDNYGDVATYNTYKEVYSISDDYILRCMAIDVKQEKRLAQLEREIEISEDSLNTEWGSNKEAYQYMVCDLAIFKSQEASDDFYKGLIDSSKSFKDLDLTEVQVGYDEKIYLRDDRLKYSLTSKADSDIIRTLTNDGYPVVLKVSERKFKREELNEDMIEALRILNAEQQLDFEYKKFQESLEIEIESEKVDM